MSELKLLEIKGVGKIVSEKLINHFRSETNAILAIESKNINELSKVDGLGQNGAIRIVRAAHDALTGENIDSLLSTPDIQFIYDNLLKIFQSYCWTSYSKSKCYIDLIPLPKKHFARLIKRQSLFRNYNQFYLESIPQSSSFQAAFHKNFQDIHPLKSKNTRLDLTERIICTTLPEVKTSLENLKFDQLFKILLINSPEDLQNIINEGNLAILISEEEFISNESNTFILANDNAIRQPWLEFVPERILNFFSLNKKSIQSMIDILELLKQEMKIKDEYKPLLPDLWDPQMDKRITMIKKNLFWLEDSGKINDNYDQELERLTKILNNFHTITDEVIEKLNDKLRLVIESENIQLSGKKFLELLQTNSSEGIFLNNLDDYIDHSIFELVEKLAQSTEKKIIETLQLLPEEVERLEENLVSRELTFPIQINTDLATSFLQFIRMKHKIHTFEIKRKLAYALESEKIWIEHLMQSVMDLDFICMIGRATKALELTWPQISDLESGITFSKAKNLFLVKEFQKTNKLIEPVAYEFGSIAKDNKEQITILSGANSGGKTTLLTLIAQIALLSHMGLGVPSSEANIGIFSEIHYYRKPTGNVDAGAFEAALKTFSKMLSDQKGKLVLADEMEAISEPEASAKVISTVLDLLATQPSTCGVFVSHLADQLRSELTEKIRIDGIEATGLDDNLQLIVNRTPKINYHARSTPQLIVERLLRSAKTDSPELQVYKSIKEKFDRK